MGVQQKRIVLVHGWNVSDAGMNSVDRLAPALESLGYEVDTDEADYGFLTWQMFSFIARVAIRPFVVQRLARAFKNADVIVTHSNGANFAHRALKQMPADSRPRLLIHFSPALNRKTRRPRLVNRMVVFYTRSDWAVKLATFIPFHPWGRMGSHGPLLGDLHTVGYDHSDQTRGHSGWFKPDSQAEKYSLAIHDLTEKLL